MIYLDNAATTKCKPSVVDVMTKYLSEEFYNPSSVYERAVSVRKDIESARQYILNAVCASNHKLLFVSGATEANNLIFSSASLRAGDKVLVSMGEHPSVFECAKHYQNKGVNVEHIKLSSDGNVDFDDFVSKMDDKVKLVLIMMVSNETGAINDIKRLCAYAKKVNNRVLFATDGVQAFGKIEVCIDDLNVDYFVCSAHKIHGPKGVGALIYASKSKIVPMMLGGGQENTLRSGTENVAGILGFAEATKQSIQFIDANLLKVTAIRNQIIEELKTRGVSFVVNGDGSPYILSLSFEGVKGEVILHILEGKGIMISTGSACSSKNSDNRILSAMGRSAKLVEGSIRLSFNAVDDYDAKFIADEIAVAVKKFKR